MPAYISEVDAVGGTGNEFVEIAVTTGTDMSGHSIYVYAADGTVSDGPLSLGSLQSTVAGTDVYVVDNALGLPDISWTDSIALVDDTGTVLQFISFNGSTTTATEGPADGETSTDIGAHGFSTSLQSNDGGSSYSAQTPNEGTVPCYAPGTLIDTPDGQRAVETLMPGDVVTTLDHGPQPIRWTRSGEHPLEGAEDEDKLVKISAGALGCNLPARDLVVSPQHRILVGGGGQLQTVFTTEAFAPAKSLTGLPGIRHLKGKSQIRWIHFACDLHEVVIANGCLSESLLLGPMVVNGVTGPERRVLTDIFGVALTIDSALNGPPARECLKVSVVKRQIANHLNVKSQLPGEEIHKWDRELAMDKYEAERMNDANPLAQSSRKVSRTA